MMKPLESERLASFAGNLQNDFSAHIGRREAEAAELDRLRDALRNSLDLGVFSRQGIEWYRSAYVEAFLFMYDTSFYDREAGRYRIDEILDDGEREFGGYDILLLWQSYPRLGIDNRNQIDYYRDMPGGLPGLRQHTTPVDQFPGGASHVGCLDMAGNVWEWTESERDDGHTRYAIIRGGSYLKVAGSIWYNASGAQPNDCHEKILLMYPGLDRCGTVGFRCVKDAAPSG